MAEARAIIEARAIELVKRHFDSLGELPTEVAQVVWVTSFRSCEVGFAAEAAGGAHGMLKDQLIGEHKLLPNLKEQLIKFDFLKKMIGIIRSQTDMRVRKADVQILVDCLKWNILEPGNLSPIRLAIARKLAKPDSLYGKPIPSQILSQ